MRWKWVALTLVLALGFYFSRGFFQHLRKPYPRNAFYQVKRADMLISVVEEGALRALNETVVRSGLEGFNRIIHLAPEGSYVEKGDLLVELDSSGLKDRLNEQELLYQQRLFQMLQATGNLKIQKSLAESDVKDGELKVENAQSDFEKYRDGDAPLLIKTVEARTGVLSEQVRIARERYARTGELFKMGNATKSEVEADALSLKREQLGLGQYEEDLKLIRKYDQPNQVRLLQSQVEQAKEELERLKQRTSNEIAQAEADLKTSQSALDFLDQGIKTLKQRLENTKIFAPQNGLVVYAPVSPFQFGGGDDRRRDEGRFRGGRGGGRGGDDGTGEFRGGGKRGGRSSLEASSGGTTRSSAAETIASGNQRIASAISGSAATQPNPSGPGGGAGAGSSGGGNASSSGDRSGAGGGGGQNASSAAGAFASYASMRPSSAFGASTATNSGANSAGSSGSSSMLSTGGQSSSLGMGNQFGSRSSSQNFRDFGGFEFSGTPGILEEGIMVRQRQELIRLPDVSKMLAEVKVEESRVRQIQAGMTAYIQVQHVPGRRFKGTVRRVAFLPDAQSSWLNPNVKLFATDILIDEELPVLKPGVSANAEIIITNLIKVLSVPIQTVARLEGKNVCFVKKGSRVAPVPVTTGWFNDSFVEITAGLKEGDLVLLAAVSDENFDGGESEEIDEEKAPPKQPPPQAIEESRGEERRFQRRNEITPNDSAAQETRPDRQRRRQNSENPQ